MNTYMKKVLMMIVTVFALSYANAQCGGFIFKNDSGTLKKYTESGSYKGSITNHVNDYDCSNEFVFIVNDRGEVKKYTHSGSYKGGITSNATRVRVSGQFVIVTTNKGEMKKYTFSGSYKGSI